MVYGPFGLRSGGVDVRKRYVTSSLWCLLWTGLVPRWTPKPQCIGWYDTRTTGWVVLRVRNLERQRYLSKPQASLHVCGKEKRPAKRLALDVQPTKSVIVSEEGLHPISAHLPILRHRSDSTIVGSPMQEKRIR